MGKNCCKIIQNEHVFKLRIGILQYGHSGKFQYVHYVNGSPEFILKLELLSCSKKLRGNLNGTVGSIDFMVEGGERCANIDIYSAGGGIEADEAMRAVVYALSEFRFEI